MAISYISNSGSLVPFAVLIVATLYSCVGAGGASAYLAMLSLLDADPAQSANTALLLNMLVAGISTLSFWRAKHLNFKMAAPFILASIPAAFFAGFVSVNPATYRVLLAIVLVIAAFRLVISPFMLDSHQKQMTPPFILSSAVGALIGYLSGLVGIGGGTLLSPVLLVCGWTNARIVAATTALFTLSNSMAALLGRAVHGNIDLGSLLPLAVVASLGAVVGSQLGARYIPNAHLQRVLAVVLIIAAGKLFLSTVH